MKSDDFNGFCDAQKAGDIVDLFGVIGLVSVNEMPQGDVPLLSTEVVEAKR